MEIILFFKMHAIQMAQDESEFVSTFYWLPLNWAGNLLISGKCFGRIRAIGLVMFDINNRYNCRFYSKYLKISILFNFSGKERTYLSTIRFRHFTGNYES